MYKSSLGRTVEKVKVSRIDSVFVMPFTTITSRNKVIKDYVYSSQARIIA